MGNKLKWLLSLSLVLNVIFLSAVLGFVYKKGGISYIAHKVNTFSNNTPASKYSPYYLDRQDLFRKLPITNGNIVFLGDSITDFAEWNELYGNEKIINRGISGDTTEGVLNRLDTIVNSHPDKVFIMIGINDLQIKNNVSTTIDNYKKILSSIKKETPNTKIFIQSVLPVNTQKYGISYPDNDAEQMNKDVVDLDNKLKVIASQLGVTYVDLYKKLADDNEIDSKYTTDGIHLTGDAYMVWRKEIEQYVAN